MDRTASAIDTIGVVVLNAVKYYNPNRSKVFKRFRQCAKYIVPFTFFVLVGDTERKVYVPHRCARIVHMIKPSYEPTKSLGFTEGENVGRVERILHIVVHLATCLASGNGTSHHSLIAANAVFRAHELIDAFFQFLR